MVYPYVGGDSTQGCSVRVGTQTSSRILRQSRKKWQKRFLRTAQRADRLDVRVVYSLGFSPPLPPPSVSFLLSTWFPDGRPLLFSYGNAVAPSRGTSRSQRGPELTQAGGRLSLHAPNTTPAFAQPPECVCCCVLQRVPNGAF